MPLMTEKTNSRDDHLLFVRKYYYGCPHSKDVFVMTPDTLSIAYEKFQIERPTSYGTAGPTNKTDKLLRLLSISNGLVCLYNYVLSYRFKNYILWNPAIRKYVTLPSPSVFPHFTTDWYDLGIGIGFWYDDKANDYKLLRVVNCLPIVVEIYELKKNAWRVIDMDNPPSRCPRGEAVWLDGALHWMVQTKDEYLPDVMRPIVVIYDVKEETFKDMGLPRDLDNVVNEDQLRLGVLGECLYVRHSGRHQTHDFWVMKEYGVAASWTKQYRLNSWITVLGMTKDKKRLLVFDDGHLKKYDPENGAFSIVLRFSSEWPHSACDHYVETLTLLNGLNQSL